MLNRTARTREDFVQQGSFLVVCRQGRDQLFQRILFHKIFFEIRMEKQVGGSGVGDSHLVGVKRLIGKLHILTKKINEQAKVTWILELW